MNRLQLGKYAEYFTKMEFVMRGCDVFTCEVDDHGIDFVVRTQDGKHYDVQVKPFRLVAGKGTPYVFLQKTKFKIHDSLLLALVQFINGEPPILYLLPSRLNGKPNPLFVDRKYEGLKSKAEWGLALSKDIRRRLADEYSFETVAEKLGAC